MISMVIGLVIIGVVFANYLGSGAGKNSSNALSQMSEDATVALNYIRKQVTQAGYSHPYQVSTTGLDRTYKGQAIFGCDGPFDNQAAPFIGELTCKTGGGTSDSIAVAFEADAQNSVMRNSGTQPGDCVGSGITATPSVGAIPSYYLAESRLYVNPSNSLSCQGNGQNSLPTTGTSLLGSAAPLVDNIVSMRIRYGVAAPAPAPRLPTKFIKASDVGVATSATWKDVVAVRVCVVVRSENEILDAATPYYGCDAIDSSETTLAKLLTTPTDRRLYRAFSTTVMVQNKL
ncbi:MAG: PilW family protein [Burkholderiales bacterium]|nr:PilW family protein [Burkholderiales bacterium]